MKTYLTDPFGMEASLDSLCSGGDGCSRERVEEISSRAVNPLLSKVESGGLSLAEAMASAYIQGVYDLTVAKTYFGDGRRGG